MMTKRSVESGHRYLVAITFRHLNAFCNFQAYVSQPKIQVIFERKITVVLYPQSSKNYQCVIFTLGNFQPIMFYYPGRLVGL